LAELRLHVAQGHAALVVGGAGLVQVAAQMSTPNLQCLDALTTDILTAKELDDQVVVRLSSDGNDILLLSFPVNIVIGLAEVSITPSAVIRRP